MKRFTRAAIAPVVVASVLAGAVVAPQAQAAENAGACKGLITDGTFDWAIKESFQNYLVGKIAKGKMELDEGVKRSDSTKVFTFPVNAAKSKLEGKSSATIALDGKVHFTGHDHGTGPILDMTLYDLKVEVIGDTLTLYTDYDSRAFVNMSTKGDMLHGDDEPMVRVKLDKAPDFSKSGAFSATAKKVFLTKTGVDVWGGFYDTETELAPLTINLTTDGTCDGGDNGGGQGGNGSGSSTGSSADSGSSAVENLWDRMFEVLGVLGLFAGFFGGFYAFAKTRGFIR
ncbi:HtaA domain-containing protein [Corynebacterium argentoratense]|uniref:HtaA domain-containing protein n=1 Tax=Corynebacterium argentoratense TaxID=42817 RepID=UPI001F37F8FF|nr:HtaA domain-containing protein [Corynebacterium argentoratense]MCF1693641.1 HtaA domain-containing protein [Corynebacterium argentoratense]MCF1734630.1 HtaA domain-containing protein [Corynebacterium argentoratense]